MAKYKVKPGNENAKVGVDKRVIVLKEATQDDLKLVAEYKAYRVNPATNKREEYLPFAHMVGEEKDNGKATPA